MYSVDLTAPNPKVLILQISSSNILLCEDFHSCRTPSESTNLVSICLVEFSFLSYLHELYLHYLFDKILSLLRPNLTLFISFKGGKNVFADDKGQTAQTPHPKAFACRLTVFPHANSVCVVDGYPGARHASETEMIHGRDSFGQ